MLNLSYYIQSLVLVKFVVEDGPLLTSWYNQSITIYTHVEHTILLRSDIRICYLSHHFTCNHI